MNRVRAAAAFLFAAFLAVLATACASAPVASPTERVAAAAVRCLDRGPCFVLQVDNASLYEATVRVNGFLVGRVGGGQAAPLFVRDALLVEDGCASVTVLFRALSRTIGSSKECIAPGGHFMLQIDPQYQAWLSPSAGR